MEPPENGDWTQEALCKGDDPRLWHSSNSRNMTDVVEYALSFCSVCPVALECVEAALEEESAIASTERKWCGVRGGTSPYQRWHVEERMDGFQGRDPVTLVQRHKVPVVKPRKR